MVNEGIIYNMELRSEAGGSELRRRAGGAPDTGGAAAPALILTISQRGAVYILSSKYIATYI